MILTGHAARMVVLENLKGRDHSEDIRRWEDNIRMDVRGIGWEDVEGMLLPQDRDQ
jgi:hypothetical protein